jgi:hypothetical protein
MISGLNNMSEVTLSSGVSFKCAQGVTILEAATQVKITIPSSKDTSLPYQQFGKNGAGCNKGGTSPTACCHI